MASMALRCGRTFLKGTRREELGDWMEEVSAASASSYSYSFRTRRLIPRKQMTVRSALTCSTSSRKPVSVGISNQETFKTGERYKRRQWPIVNSESLDEWMTQAVTEIVRNIGEAPFLVHVYSDREKGGGGPTRLEREKATGDNWPHIKTRWEEVEEKGNDTPDGVILVKQLSDSDDDGDEKNLCANSSRSSRSNLRSSGLWGIVIQGRGLDRSACYILETTRVCSSIGFCTHYCLVKAKCFGKSPELQLRDSWLLT